MVHIKNKKENLVHRLKIARGQLNKVLSMVERDEYCIDILHNSLSIQRALKRFDMMIMEDHLKTCAINQVLHGEKDKMVNELITIYKYK